MSATEYEPVVGLEIHAELRTASKMFCPCPVLDVLTAEPNAAVCPVCTAQPGAMPALNARAVEMGMMVGLALNCRVQAATFFARKNYFYPDLPKGYQLSQSDHPLAFGGWLDVPGPGGEPRRVGIRRVHLEEDTAKLLHVRDASGAGTHCLADFNRAGVPLLEIVSEPDLHDVETVAAYATAVRAVLRNLGVNLGEMEKGVLRFEANVSVRPRGSTALGTRTEIKNLNSFKSLTKAVAAEVERQIETVRAGSAVVQQTLGWHEEKEDVFRQRKKEEAHEYRYLPEPDLPPFVIDPSWVEKVRQSLPEATEARVGRFASQYGLPPADAQLLGAERALADYFEAAAREYGGPAKAVANWMTGELARLMNEANTPVEQLKVTPERLAALLKLVDAGAVNQTGAKEVLAEVFATGAEPGAVVQARGLTKISDRGRLEQVVRELVGQNAGQVAQYRAGKGAVLQWFVGQVMRATRGQADAAVVRELLLEVMGAPAGR